MALKIMNCKRLILVLILCHYQQLSIQDYAESEGHAKLSEDNMTTKKDYNNVIDMFRKNWESPMAYLIQRGYIPLSEAKPDKSSSAAIQKMLKEYGVLDEKQVIYSKPARNSKTKASNQLKQMKTKISNLQTAKNIRRDVFKSSCSGSKHQTDNSKCDKWESSNSLATMCPTSTLKPTPKPSKPKAPNSLIQPECFAKPASTPADTSSVCGKSSNGNGNGNSNSNGCRNLNTNVNGNGNGSDDMCDEYYEDITECYDYEVTNTNPCSTTTTCTTTKKTCLPTTTTCKPKTTTCSSTSTTCAPTTTTCTTATCAPKCSATVLINEDVKESVKLEPDKHEIDLFKDMLPERFQTNNAGNNATYAFSEERINSNNNATAFRLADIVANNTVNDFMRNNIYTPKTQNADSLENQFSINGYRSGRSKNNIQARARQFRQLVSPLRARSSRDTVNFTPNYLSLIGSHNAFDVYKNNPIISFKHNKAISDMEKSNLKYLHPYPYINLDAKADAGHVSSNAFYVANEKPDAPSSSQFSDQHFDNIEQSILPRKQSFHQPPLKFYKKEIPYFGSLRHHPNRRFVAKNVLE